MNIYLFNILLILIYGIYCRILRFSVRKTGMVLYSLGGLQLLLVSVLRSTEVGGDLKNYLPTFQNIANHSWNGLIQDFGFEPGYVLLNKICSVFSDDDFILLFACGIICVPLYINFLRHNSRIPYLSLLLFIGMGFYTSTLSMLRQAIAIAIVINGLPYIEKRQFGRFLCTVLLGASFHFTALIFLILYPISRIKIGWGYFAIVLSGAALFSLTIGRSVLAFMINRLYSLYEGNEVRGEGYTMLFFLIAVTAFGLFVRSRIPLNERKQQDIFYHMMILACGLQFLSLQFSLFARIILYFSSALMVFVPNTISMIKPAGPKAVMHLVWIGFIFFYFTTAIIGPNSSGIVPYTFFWE